MTRKQLLKKNNRKSNRNRVNHLKTFPKKEKREMSELEMYSGPIPHPKILRGYEKLYPGSAKLMINNGVDESKHRRKLESARQKRRGHLSYIALIGSLFLMTLCLILSFILILKDHIIVGSVFFLVDIFVVLGSMSDLSDKLSSNDDFKNDK